MNNTRTTEQQIATFARRMARKARTLRSQGRHDEADALVRESAGQVEAYRGMAVA